MTTINTNPSVYTLTLVSTQNTKFTGEGCFGVYSSYYNARATFANILKNFNESIEDYESIPTGRRYYTNQSTWELEKFQIDELVL